MSSILIGPSVIASQRRWQQIDWAMKSVSLAMHLCAQLQCHGGARTRR
jgi:hypothetical protein